MDASLRDVVALRLIPARVATITAGLVALTAASLSSGLHLGVAAPIAVEVVPTPVAVSAEVLAELTVLRRPAEPLDDELLQLPLRGPLGSTAILRSPPPRAVPPPRVTTGIARVAVPRLGIDHYVERIAIVGGVMESPADGVYAIGWYAEFGTPGSGGNIVLSAHETWDHQYAPFYAMHLALPGDRVEVELASGTRYTYEVVSSNRYALEQLAMNAVISPPAIPTNEEWVTFITCGGRIVYDASGFGDYLDRDIVVAKRVR
jgi:sortase (surface protein transpeptidase)